MDSHPWATYGLLGESVDQLPYLVFLVGAVLGWAFHRTKVFFAEAILALSYCALLTFAPEGAPANGGGHYILATLGFLVPLNLVLLYYLPEVELRSRRGILRVLFLAAQAAALSWGFGERSSITPLLTRPLSDMHIPGVVSQKAALASLLAFLAIALRPGGEHRAIQFCYLPALAAVSFAFQGGATWFPGNEDVALAVLFGGSGLALLFGILSFSYRAAFLDELTQIPGRRALEEELRRLGNHYAIAMVDIDHFKRFNDRHGHDVGDDVLRLVAARLAKSSGAKAFRYGGEEFCLLFPGGELSRILEALDEVRERVAAERHAVASKKKGKRGTTRRLSVSVTISIGVAERSNDRRDPWEVIKAADKALYRAKKRGRNRVMK